MSETSTNGTRQNHWGDCTIYSALINGRPWDGICTCGFGWDYLSHHGGDDKHMLSDERREEERRMHIVHQIGLGIMGETDET